MSIMPTVIPITEGPAPRLQPAVHRVFLENLAIDADIGFFEHEIGTPQRLLVSVEVSLDLAFWPVEDTREAAWNYDFIRNGVQALLRNRRFNLQETLAREIFDMIAARPGVRSVTVRLSKPDIYPDAESVGVILSSG